MTDSLRRNAALLSATSVSVGALNYLLNLYLANRLSAVGFGDASLVINLVLIVSAVGATLQLVAARAIALGQDSAITMARFARFGAWGGITLGLTITLGAKWLQGVLQVSSPWLFVVLGASMPIYLLQSVRRGIVQGQLDMRCLARSFAAEAATRLVASVIFVELGGGPLGAVIAIGVSFAASFVVTRPKPQAGSAPSRRTAVASERSFAMATATLLCAQVVIASGDVIAAKNVLAPAAAGSYAALALVGRVPFFVTVAIANAAFPAAAKSDPVQRRTIVLETTGLVSVVTAVSVGSLWVFGPAVLPKVLGPELTIETSLAIRYVVTTSCFSLAYVLATIGLAAGSVTAIRWLVAAAALQTVLLFQATTADRLVTLQLIVMVLCMIGTAWTFVRSVSRLEARPEPGLAQPV